MPRRPFDEHDLYGRLIRSAKTVEETATTVAAALISASELQSLSEILDNLRFATQALEALVTEMRIQNQHLSALSGHQIDSEDLPPDRGDMV